jgi:hypothetical protein
VLRPGSSHSDGDRPRKIVLPHRQRIVASVVVDRLRGVPAPRVNAHTPGQNP